MKDSLREFIDKNREGFDHKHPKDSAWKTISDALPQMKHVSLWNSVMVWRAAAVLFMGLSAFLLLNNVNKRAASASEKISQVQLQGEFQDVESFYSDEIAKKVALIDDFGGSFVGDEFTQDFEKLDAMYQVLRDQLKTDPSEKVRDALILNILVRIDLLNQQIKRLEDRKTEKKTDAST
ncbi:MAG: hypothetical protein K8H85_02460 [Cyclobacteriaceae bacterium]|nr:hypothetical protein [Cyclobacteriaceae bacterium]